MPMQTEYFSAHLNSRLEPTDIYLPLSPAATADLLGLLSSPDDYIYLTLKGDVHMETVRVHNDSGTLIIDRGLEDTVAALHHYGTCVSSISPTVIAVIKDLICNYSCCEDGDCPCNPVVFSGSVLPVAHVGVEWSGSVVFTGDTPMHMGVEGIPSWMTVVQEGALLKLSGVPTTEGNIIFSVAATNCNGTTIANTHLQFTVTA